MSYINAELRKNNLLLDVVEDLVSAVAELKFSFIKRVNAADRNIGKARIRNSHDYYFNAPKRVEKAVSIEAQLVAQGNAW